MSQKLVVALKSFFLNGLAKLFAKSYYLTQIARRVVQIYDNDCNPDIKTNGELLLIKRIVALRKNGIFLTSEQIKVTGLLRLLNRDSRGRYLP